MKYEDLRRDNTVYYCRAGSFEFLFRFENKEGNKNWLNPTTGVTGHSGIDVFSSDIWGNFREATIEEQCEFHNKLGYLDSKGRLWKVGDLDVNGDQIIRFRRGLDSWKSKYGKVWAETKYEGDEEYGGSTYWLDESEFGPNEGPKKISEQLDNNKLTEDLINWLKSEPEELINVIRESLNKGVGQISKQTNLTLFQKIWRSLV